METEPPRIFISHSSADLPFVRKLAEDLQHVMGNEVPVWYDAHLEGGDLWWRKIMKEIQRSTIFLIVWSPAATASDWVNNEIDQAWLLKNSPTFRRAKVQVIPLIYQPCLLRLDLATVQSIYFSAPRLYEEAFQELLQTIDLSPKTLNRNISIKTTKENIKYIKSTNSLHTFSARRLKLLISQLSTIHLILHWAALIILLGLLLLTGDINQNNQLETFYQLSVATAAAKAYATATSGGIYFGFDAAHTHWNRYEQIINAKNVSRIALMWSYPTGDTAAHPLVANGMLYIGSSDHKLYVFNASCKHACTPLWSYTTGNSIISSPAMANGILYVGSTDHKLYAFDAFCRHACIPLWSYTTGGIILPAPTISNGILYIGSGDNKLYAFDISCRSKCIPLWTYATGKRIGSSSAVANGILYIGSDDHKLYAFDTSCRSKCTPLWSYTTGDNVFSSPSIANGMVYVGSLDGNFYAFDASCRSKCVPIWSYTTGGQIFSSPAVANGIVYVGSLDHKFYAFDTSCRHACTPLWSYITNGYIRSSPTIANGVVYIGSDDHKLYAFDASCRSVCLPLWSFLTAGSVASLPAVANGMIYIGTDIGEIYAFALPLSPP